MTSMLPVIIAVTGAMVASQPHASSAEISLPALLLFLGDVVAALGFAVWVAWSSSR